MRFCLKRAIALFTLVFFLATSLNFPAANAANPGETLHGEKGTGREFLPVPFSIQVPAQFGKIDEFFHGKSSRTVVLIQDAHAVPDAQRNIWKLIEHFEKEYGIRQVAVEGAASELDAQFFRSFPDKSRLKKVFEEYLQKGELSGPNAAALFSDSQAEYHGIEDWALYEEGLGYFLKAEEKKPEILRKLEMESKKLEEEKRGTYSKQLFEIDQELEKFQENHENLAAVLKKLALARRAPKGSTVAMLLEEIESDKGQWGRDEVKQEQKYSEMSGRFNREFEVYARSVKEKLFRNEKERELNLQSRGLYLQKKLAKLELAKDEWKEIAECHSRMVLGGNPQACGSPKKAFGDDMPSHLAFYENAEKRDAVFFEKLKKLKENLVLTAGGFHAQGLTRRFKEAGISYVLVRPEIKDIPDSAIYRQQMRGDVSWKSYFRVENGKVNLSDAFIRAARDRLLDAGAAPTLKSWRDQILLDLVQKEQITKAHESTRFLDELALHNSLSSPKGLIGDPFSKFRPDWMKRLEKFIEGLRHLDANHQLTEENILQLFSAGGRSALGGKPSAMPGATIANQFAARSELRADLMPGLMPLRGDVPSKAEAQSAGESKVGISAGGGVNAGDSGNFQRQSKPGKSLALKVKASILEKDSSHLPLSKALEDGRSNTINTSDTKKIISPPNPTKRLYLINTLLASAKSKMSFQVSRSMFPRASLRFWVNKFLIAGVPSLAETIAWNYLLVNYYIKNNNNLYLRQSRSEARGEANLPFAVVIRHLVLPAFGEAKEGFFNLSKEHPYKVELKSLDSDHLVRGEMKLADTNAPVMEFWTREFHPGERYRYRFYFEGIDSSPEIMPREYALPFVKKAAPEDYIQPDQLLIASGASNGLTNPFGLLDLKTGEISYFLDFRPAFKSGVQSFREWTGPSKRESLYEELWGKKPLKLSKKELIERLRSVQNNLTAKWLWLENSKTLNPIAREMRGLYLRTVQDGFGGYNNPNPELPLTFLKDFFNLPQQFLADYIRALEMDKTKPNVAGAKRAVRIALDAELAIFLSLLSLRIWDEGDPNQNLEEMGSLLDILENGKGSSGHRFFKSPLALADYATAVPTPAEDDSSYIRFNEKVEKLRPEYQRQYYRKLLGDSGRHLRAFYTEVPQEPGVFLWNTGTEDRNAVDLIGISTALRWLLNDIETGGLNETEKSKNLEAVLQGLSGYPGGMRDESLLKRLAQPSNFLGLGLEGTLSEALRLLAQYRPELLKKLEEHPLKSEDYSAFAVRDPYQYDLLRSFLLTSALDKRFEKFEFESYLTPEDGRKPLKKEWMTKASQNFREIQEARRSGGTLKRLYDPGFKRFILGKLKEALSVSRSEARTQAGRLKPGEIFQKRYEILRQVSKTESSGIYEAYDKTRKRPVILKLRGSKWFPQLSYEDKKGKKLFEDNKEDPVSPEYLDLGKDEKSAWITVAKEEGQNVLDWSKGKKPVEIQDLFGKILETVAKVHQQKHLHLDLKASNTWVRPDGQIRLLDWEGALMHGMADLPFYGFTPAYSVPDNFPEWKNPVPQTDIFPLGMLLYFLATDGHHTFALPEVSGKVLIKEFFEKKGRMANAREIETQKELRGLFKPFAPLIAKAIHAVPDQRYASIAEMRLDFFKIYGRIADQNGGIVFSPEQQGPLEAQREQISRQYNLNEKARAGLEQAEVELRVNIFITGMPGGRELLRLRADNLLAIYKKKAESEKKYFQSNLFATPLLAAWMLQAGGRFEEYDQALEQANPAQRSRIADLLAYFKNYIEAHHYDPAWIKKINRSEARAPQEQIQFPIYLDAETVQAIESLEVLPVMQEVAKTKLSILYKTEIKVAGRKVPILLKRPRAQPTAEKQESAENAIKNEAENMKEILEHPLFSKSGGKLYIEGKWWQHPNIRLGYWSPKLAGLVMPYLEPLQGATDAYDFFIERNTKMTPRQYFTIAREMAGAVGFLHHLGIVHHDIKPQNFFMTQHHPVLTDLNLTYNTKGSRLPIRGGTEMFSSEKHFKEDPRFTHDVYSLGVTILRIWLGIQGDEQGTEMGFTRLIGLKKKNQWTDEVFLEKINFKRAPPEMEAVIRKAMGGDPYMDAVEMEKAVREAENRFRNRSQKALEAKPSQPPVPEPSAEVEDPEAEFIPGVRWKLELTPTLENLRHTGTEEAPKIRIPEQWDDLTTAKVLVKDIDPRLRFIGIAGIGTTGLVYLVEKNGEPFALKIPVGAEYWNEETPMNSDIQHNLLIDGARHIVEHDILLGFHAQSTKLVPGLKGFYEIRLLDTKGGEYPSTALLTEHVTGMEIEDYLRIEPGGQREFARQFTGIVMTLRGQDLSLQGLNEGDRLSLSARHFRMQDVLPASPGASPPTGNAEKIRLRLVGMAELYGAEGHSQIKKIEERDALPGILKSAIHKIFETILISQPASDAVVRIPPDDPQIEAGIAEGLDQFFKGSSTHLEPAAPKSEARIQTIESLLSVPERKYIIGIHERLSSWRLKVSLQKELQDISFARVPTPDQILEFQEEGYLNPKGGKVTEKTLAKVRAEILGIVAGPDKDPQKAFLETLQKKFFDLGNAALDEMGVWEQGLLGQMIAEEPAPSPEQVQEIFSFLEGHIQKLEKFWSPASREKKTKSGYVFHVWKEQLERKYAKRLRLTKALLEMARRLHSGNYQGVGSFYEKMEARLKNDRDYQGFFQETAKKIKRQAQERQGQDEVLQKNLDRFFFQAAEKSVVDRSDQRHLREKMAVDKPPLLITEQEGILKVSPNPEYFNPFLGPNEDTRYPLIPIAAALEDVLKRAGPEIREHLRLPAFKAYLDDDFISDLVFRMQHVLYERETGALREFIWEYLSDVLALEKGATAGDLGLYEKYLRFAREYWTREKPGSKAAMLSSIAKLPSFRVVLEGEPGSRDPEAMVLEKNIYSFQPWRTVQTTEGPRLLPAEKIIFASWKGRRFSFYTSRSHMLQTTLARRWRQAEAVLGMWFVKQHPENIDDLPLNLSLLLDEAIRSPLMASSSSVENWQTRLQAG